MKRILLRNANAILPGEKLENARILIENEKISEISDRDIQADRIIELDELTLYPGFIDIHIHGVIGIDSNEATTEDFRKIAAFLASKGTTAWLPTFVPDADENYLRQIKAIDELMKIQSGLPVAQALGVHYEGVFANEKMCGALRPEFFKRFTGDEVEKLPKLEAKNAVHLTTFAPEIEGGIELVEELIKHGWTASIGHTKADAETLDRAFSAGAKHMTHFFNAMTGLHHREVGVVGWGLTNENVTCDIIADGIHVHPRMLKLAHRVKTSENLLLISDAVSPAGLGDGDYEIWNEKVSVAGGRTQNERGSIAGSVITLLEAVGQMLSLGIAETRGSIETGKRADLVALDKKGNVRLCLTAGEVACSDF
jgi:N-acetylglucosamine-6-phosphate deacetylase